jgi:predicted outer membrane lipoprotein
MSVDTVSLPEQADLMRGNNRWNSPLVLAILAAAVGLVGNIWMEHANNRWKKDTDFFNVQSALILDAIRTGDPNAACENLRLLVGLGYLTDKDGTIQTQCRGIKVAPPQLPGAGSQARGPARAESSEAP